jgi:hypothetical protein
MRFSALNSAAWLAMCVLGLSRSAAGETPGLSTAEPAKLPIVAIGQDFSVGPTETITPADPYEAYTDPNDLRAGRRGAVVIQASAEMPASELQSVIKQPEAATAPSVSVSQRLQGKVVLVDANSGVVRIAFPAGREPRVGDVVKITHAYLFGRDEIGKLRIVRTGHVALARPVGQWEFSRPIPGDMVDYWSRPAPSAPQMPVPPTLAAR